VITLDITPEEIRNRIMTPEHLQAAVGALRRDGFVVLNHIIETAHLERLRERMLADVEAILAREDAPFNFNTGNLQQDPPPFAPYLFHDVLLNDMVFAVTKAILGRGVKNSYYSGNTNLPGSSEQPVHVDLGQLWPDLEVAPPAYALVVNVPVVDMDAENGSTELWPGTHLDTTLCVQQMREDKDIIVPEALLEQRRKIAPPLQPSVGCGGALIRDVRLWHRGMPNRTRQPRPMIAMIHYCSWWHADPIPFPKGTEAFFKDSDLATNAVFVAGPIDYIHHNRAYDFQR